MEIKTKSTFQEKMDAAIIMRKLSGMLSKDNKRYSIIFKADNEAIARERVHRE